jgi:phosphoribosylformimino-5-aminoimidazole carboxamide ribotide isomerase
MATPFDVIPAIDLRGGRVVRLQQGDFDRETVYGNDPGAVAASFTEAGARVLHVVDLDGARAGEPSQLRSVGEIARAVGTRAIVEAAGGLRSINDVDAAFDAGPGAWSSERPRSGSRPDPRRCRRARLGFGRRRRRRPGRSRRRQRLGGRERSTCRGRDPCHDRRRRRPVRSHGDRSRRAPGRPGPGAARGAGRARRGVAHRVGRDPRRRRPDRHPDLGCAGAIVGRALYEGRLDLATAIGTVQVPPT